MTFPFFWFLACSPSADSEPQPCRALRRKSANHFIDNVPGKILKRSPQLRPEGPPVGCAPVATRFGLPDLIGDDRAESGGAKLAQTSADLSISPSSGGSRPRCSE